MQETAAHTAQSLTGVKQDNPKVTSRRAWRDRRSTRSSPTTPSSTRSGSKDSRAHVPSRQSVSAALAVVRARKGSSSPTASPRDENGMTKRPSAFWSESLSPTSKTNRLPLTPKKQASPKGQSSLMLPIKQAASPPPTSPRTSQVASSISSSPDSRSPHQRFLLDSFASRAYAPTLPTLSIITDDQENQRSEHVSLASENASQRRSRFMAIVRNSRSRRVTSPSSAQLSPRPCTTLDSLESSVLDPGSLARGSHVMKGVGFVGKEGSLTKEVEAVSGPDKVDSQDTWLENVDSACSITNISIPSEDELDPAIEKSLGDFIDSLNRKKLEEHPETIDAIVASFSSSDSIASVDPETLKNIACFIDSVSKKGAVDSFSDEEVPAETRAGISAFIESLEKEVQTPTNTSKEKETEDRLLYVSSSDETNHIDKEDLKATYDEILNNRSDDHSALEIANHGTGPLASLNPSDLAGEHFLQSGNSKVSTKNEAKEFIDEIENNSQDGLSGGVEEARDGDQLLEMNDEAIEIFNEDRSLNVAADGERVPMIIPFLNLSKSEEGETRDGDQLSEMNDEAIEIFNEDCSLNVAADGERVPIIIPFLNQSKSEEEETRDGEQLSEMNDEAIEIFNEDGSLNVAADGERVPMIIPFLNLSKSEEGETRDGDQLSEMNEEAIEIFNEDRSLNVAADCERVPIIIPFLNLSISEEGDQYAKTLLVARKAMERVGDVDQHTEKCGNFIGVGIETESHKSAIVNAEKAIAALNPIRKAIERVGDVDHQHTEKHGDVIGVGIETESHKSAIVNAEKAIAALNPILSPEAGAKHEQDRHDARGAVSEDEASYARKVIESVCDFDLHTEINGEVIEIGIESDSHNSAIVNEEKAIVALNLNSSPEAAEKHQHGVLGVKCVRDFDQYMEINGEVIEIGAETNSRNSAIVNAEKAIASAEVGGKHEQNHHDVRGAVSEDEASYLFNAFFVGSDMDLSIDPILHDPSTMKSIDEDENIERFLVKTFTLPVGSSKEELMILNSYIRQAGILMQNGSTPEERSNLVTSAIRDGVPKNVTEEIFLWLTSVPEEGGSSPTSNHEHNAQEANSIDEEESFDRFLRETIAEAERSEEEVRTHLLRINIDTIKISDDFEPCYHETYSVEEQVGTDVINVGNDAIEISHTSSSLDGPNTSKSVKEATAARGLCDTASEDAATDHFIAFVLGSNMDESNAPVVPNPSAIKADDEDEHNERYLAHIGNVTQIAQRTVEEVEPGDRTEIEPILPNPSRVKIDDEDEQIERDLADIGNVAQKAQHSVEEVKADERTEIEPILPNPSAMKTVDEDEHNERYLSLIGNVAQKAQRTVEEVEAGECTEIEPILRNPSRVKIVDEDEQIERNLADIGNVAQKAQQSVEEVKADEQNCHDFRATVSDDEACYMFNAFIEGSDMDLSIDPILPDFSTMKSIDEDENIERFLTRWFTLPEGAAMEDLEVINSYIRQAGNLMQNGSTPEERSNLVNAAIRDGVPKELTDEISLWLTSAPEEGGALPAKLDDEKSDDESHGDACIFPDPTLPDPFTSMSTTDSVSEQLKTLLTESTADQADASIAERKTSVMYDIIDKLALHEGASAEEIEHLNKFKTLAAPVLCGKSLSDVDVMEIRSAAKIGGISVAFVDEVLCENGSLKLSSSGNTIASTTAGDLRFRLTTSSIVESQDESIEVSFDMGRSDVKEQIVTDEEEEEEVQARWVDDANEASPIVKSVLSEQQSTIRQKGFFFEENFDPVYGVSSGTPGEKGPFVGDFENGEEVQALGAGNTTEAHSVQKSAFENTFVSVSAAPFGATYEKEEEEEVQGWGVANSVDWNAPLPEHQRTAEESITVDYDGPSKSKSSDNLLISVSPDVTSMKLGVPDIATVNSNECLSPTIDRYAFPPTPVKDARGKTAASIVAALAVNAPQMKVEMPQERGALGANLPPPPLPSFPHPTSPKMGEVILEESERYAIPPTPKNLIEEKTVVEARAVKLSQPPSPQTRAAVPRESYHANQSLSPTSKLPISRSRPRFFGGGTAAAAIAKWSPHIRKGRRQRIPVTQQWKLSYKERTKNHPGYFNVNEYSLRETSAVVSTPHKLDDVPWEDRDVKQRFLHEHSVSFSRNWFGNLSRRRGNDRYREPVCRPQSMKMPMTRLPERDWEKEWYLTWQSQKLSHLAHSFDANSSHSSSGYSSRSDEHTGSVLSGSIFSGSLYSESYVESVFTRDTFETGGYGEEESESEDGTWWEDEDAPECGYIVNVKQKIGERVSRVHPEHTSSLRRSRWRKKHFPRGTFPY